MKIVQHTQNNRVRVLWLSVALALVAALSYLMIQMGVLGVGDLKPSEQPSAIVYMAAGCYVLGGLLILLRRRWLWNVGAVINALVILFFAMAYIHRPSVMFSTGGLVTKITQLLLEVCLLVLIVAGWHHSRRRIYAG